MLILHAEHDSCPRELHFQYLIQECLMKTRFLQWQVCLALLTCSVIASAQSPGLKELAGGNLPAKQASKLAVELQNNPELQLGDVLTAMQGGSQIGQNWLVSIAQTIADRAPESASAELQKFLADPNQSQVARYWAFEYLTKDKQELRESMLKNMLDDPCLEIRYEAVKLGLEETKSLDSDAKSKALKTLLASARLPTQVQTIAKELEEFDVDVDLKQHFGFICDWKAIGPFNNVDKVGFASDYAVEADYAQGKIDPNKKYDGKKDSVAWQAVSTDADDGAVDLAAAYAKEKGAVVYALGEFSCPGDVDCEVRLGSPNASKVWVNGDLVIAREVYHSGNQIDQYVAPVKLKKGANSILIKSCQNEQDQSWAQDWTFQLRFTDASGAAIKPST